MTKIISKIKNFLLSAGKTVLLVAACFAAGFAVVFPLWKFAACAPSAYTAAVLAVLGIILVLFIVRKILNRKNGS